MMKRLAFMILAMAVAHGQQPEPVPGLPLEGYYPVQNFTHEDYGAHYQNWFITQDQNGFIYAGNGAGVLEYDGAQWRLITHPGLQTVRTVEVDKNNIKWVGADSDLGFLEPDSLGLLQYHSLKDSVPADHPLAANVWQIFPQEDRVLFVTDRTIYCWQDGRMRVIPVTGNIYREYAAHGIVYFCISGKGMCRLEGDNLRLIPGGEIFAGLRPVVGLPYGEDSVLFGTRDSGIYIFDGNGVAQLPSEVGEYLARNNLYAGKRLPDNTYAFATLNGGVIWMDASGKRLRVFGTADGILNDQVLCLSTDTDHALWMALQTGISRVDLQLPYTFFDKRSGLEGTVSAVTRHQEKLYVGTYTGLYVLEPDEGMDVARFRKVPGLQVGCFSLLSIDGDLLAGTANGTLLYRNEKWTTLNEYPGTRVLFLSAKDPARVFVGHMHGLATVYRENGQWAGEHEFSRIKDDVFTIAADSSGTLWVSTSLHEILELDLEEEGRLPVEMTPKKLNRYRQGLPPGSSHLFLLGDEVYATVSGEGEPVYLLDRNSGTFRPAADFSKLFGLDSLQVVPSGIQHNGEYLLLESVQKDGIQYRFSARRDFTGRYTAQRLFDERFRSITDIRLLWEEDPAVLWIGGEEMVRYELDAAPPGAATHKAYIRKVVAGGDSLLFGGEPQFKKKPVLPFSRAGLRFEFASSSLQDPAQTEYQYLLSGLDETWSSWSHESRKDYTNLPEGDYRFQVKARDLYGNQSLSAPFAFIILPPWYRSWWAYCGYLLLTILLVWGSVRWRARQLRQENILLEQQVAMRTAEVRHQANQLKIQAEKLLELDRAKSRFFANISHEFRTPLTLIKGPIEQLEREGYEPLSRENVKMIRRNANRLLHMVNQLLDLARIDEGSLQLTPTEGDVYKCLRAAASSFNSHAAQRGIDYRVSIPPAVLWASFDRDKLENIVYNLLGNAFKFSEDGATISFTASFGKGELLMEVSDTGKGIPAAKLPHIFERFYQADASATKDKEGSGIGLSLSRDLVELMEGRIVAESEAGKGSRFVVNLPLDEIRTRRTSPAQESPGTRPLDTPPRVTLPIPAPADNARILVVEDNEDMRHFIRDQLSAHYRVQLAVNGAEGYELALKITPDLVISDLMMPKMDGIELCRKLKSELATSHIPIIMLTAKAGMENKIEGLETGADDYLTKPFSSRELLTRTRNLIAQRRRLRDYYSRQDMQIHPGEVAVTSIDQRFLEKLLALLEAHYHDPDFGVPQLQEALAMSKTQLHRKLKALTNASPGELLRHFRLKRAAQLLLEKEDSVTQIAYKVGFNNLSYFAKCFRELYGVPPSSYTP